MYILNTFNLTSFKCILQVFERITIKSILLVLHKNSNFYCQYSIEDYKPF